MSPSALSPSIRRVVTGHDPDGLAVIASDGAPPRVNRIGEGGPTMHEIWNTQESPARIDAMGGEPFEDRLRLAPPAGGTRLRIVDIPPEPATLHQVTEEEARAHFAIMDAAEASTKVGNAHPYMHRTQSIDYGIVLHGEVHMIMDKGEVLLRAGDVVVQRGTNHAWANRSGAPCRVAFVLVDGRFEDGLERQRNP